MSVTPPLVRPLARTSGVSVTEYKCRAARHDPRTVEVHGAFSVAIVKKGSFGYAVRGKSHELVAGSVLLGHASDEYVCSHDHAIRDECIAFNYSAELLDALAGGAVSRIWRTGALPPIAELMVLGARTETSANLASDVAVDEIALEIAARVVETIGERTVSVPTQASPSDRRRAVRAAELVEARFTERLDAETLAASVGLSPFHFLRLFTKVVGVTPHQYLVRTRLAAAARLLASAERSITEVALDVGFGDVSGFIRAFGRAAGVSPRRFRQAARSDRRIFQDRLRLRP